MLKHTCISILTLLLGTLPCVMWGTYDLSVTPGNLAMGVMVGNTCARTILVNNTGAGSAPYSLMMLPTSLLADQQAYYPFNGYFQDMFTLDAGNPGNCAFVADRHGIASSALRFNGNSIYTARDFGLEDTFGISFWARPEVDGTVIPQGYYYFGLSANYILGPDWGGYGNRAGLGIALNRQGMMVIEHAAGYMPCLFSYSADLSAWHHYTVLFHNHVPSVYIDGVLVGTGITSQRQTTYLSHVFGSYAYGSYTGKLDDVCVFGGMLSGDQITALHQYSDNRYRFDPAFGTIPAASSQSVIAGLVDAGLPVGTYEDTVVLCQPGDPIQFGNFAATLAVSSVGPKSPGGISITRQPDGDYLLSWQYVTQNTLNEPFFPTLYRVYGGTAADEPFLIPIGSSGQNSFLVDADALPPGIERYFFHVKAE